MMTRITIAVVPLLVIFSMFCDRSSADDLVWRDQLHCGVNSSYIFLKLENIEVEYDEVLAAMGVTENGTSLKRIKSYLNSHGLRLAAIQSKPSQLGQLALPAIVFLEPDPSQKQAIGHFNVLVAVDESTVTYIDGTTGAVWDTSRIQFAKTWSGIALAKTAPSMVPYLAICIFGCGFLAFRLRYLFFRRWVVATAAGLLIFFTMADSTLGQNKQQVIESLEKRQNALPSGEIAFRKYSIQAGEPDKAIYEIQFSYRKNKRYLLHIDFDGLKRSSSQRAYDGKFYRSRIGSSYQLHSTDSARLFEAGRFDTLFLDFAGIFVTDPLLKVTSQKQRCADSILSILKTNSFGVSKRRDGMIELKQRVPTRDKNSRTVLVCDPKIDNMIVQRTIYCANDERLSEFRYLDYQQVGQADVWVPGKIEFRSFDYRQEVNDAFGLLLLRFDSPTMKPIPPKIQPVIGGILVNYTHITADNKKTAEPMVTFAGATRISLDRTIQNVKNENKVFSSPSTFVWPYRIAALAIGSVVVFVFFITRRDGNNDQ